MEYEYGTPGMMRRLPTDIVNYIRRFIWIGEQYGLSARHLRGLLRFPRDDDGRAARPISYYDTPRSKIRDQKFMKCKLRVDYANHVTWLGAEYQDSSCWVFSNSKCPWRFHVNISLQRWFNGSIGYDAYIMVCQRWNGVILLHTRHFQDMPRNVDYHISQNRRTADIWWRHDTCRGFAEKGEWSWTGRAQMFQEASRFIESIWNRYQLSDD